MKNPCFLLSAAMIAVYSSYGQNTFPANGGNVGVGTSAPLSGLHVEGNTGNSAKVLVRGVSGINPSLELGSTEFGAPLESGEGFVLKYINDVGETVFNNLYTLNPNAFRFQSAGNDRLTIQNSGNVGIGTANPTVKLEVNGNTYLNNGSTGNGVQGATLSFDNSHGMVGANKIKLYAAPTWVGGLGIKYNTLTLHSGGNYSFYTGTTASSDGDNRMTILVSGNVGIGTTLPDAALAVNCTIHSKGVKVDLIGFPDYVFKPSYRLRSLADVKKYIDKNSHLPEMPSEKQVSQDGLNLGEMNKLLVKKVEELTLYLIKKDKEVSSQRDAIKKLQKQQKNNGALMKRISRLEQRIK